MGAAPVRPGARPPQPAGRITLARDALVVVDDLRAMVRTAEPGTEDAERLALAVVLGTQTLVDTPDAR